MSLEWMTPRPPSEDAIRLEKGILSLEGSRYPLSEVGARNILLRRQEDFLFYADTTLPSSTVLSLQEKQEAGLICYYDENTWVALLIEKENNLRYIMVKEHIGDKDIVHGKEELPEQIKTITLSVETNKLERRFFYSVQTTMREEIGEYTQGEFDKKESRSRLGDNLVKEVADLKNVYYLCDEGLKKGKRFTGAMVGVYAYAGEEKLTAQFLDFSYVSRTSCEKSI